MSLKFNFPEHITYVNVPMFNNNALSITVHKRTFAVHTQELQQCTIGHSLHVEEFLQKQ